jgi:integrase
MVKLQLKANEWLSDGQLRDLIDYVRKRARKLRSRRARTDRLIVEILCFAGLRADELCSLNLADLPCTHGHWQIQVISGKGDKNRAVPIAQGLVDTIEEYVQQYRGPAEPKDPLLLGKTGQRMKAYTVWAKVSRIGVALGYDKPEGRRRKDSRRNTLYPHRLRHSYAMRSLRLSGGNLDDTAAKLGHADINTTRVYTRTASAEASRVAHEVYF